MFVAIGKSLLGEEQRYKIILQGESVSQKTSTQPAVVSFVIQINCDYIKSFSG